MQQQWSLQNNFHLVWILLNLTRYFREVRSRYPSNGDILFTAFVNVRKLIVTRQALINFDMRGVRRDCSVNDNGGEGWGKRHANVVLSKYRASC